MKVSKWKKDSRGRYARSFGSRGTRVRVFQREPGGAYYREVWRGEQGVSRKSLKTRDRRKAEELGKKFAAMMVLNQELVDSDAEAGDVGLRDLWNAFRKETFESTSIGSTRKEELDSEIEILCGFFGDDCEVSKLTFQDREKFIQARLSGRVQYLRKGEVVSARPVRLQRIKSNVALLYRLIRWGMRQTPPLVSRNPFEGIRLPAEKNPRRPVASWDRYRAMRQAFRRKYREETREELKLRWHLARIFLSALYHTGRRTTAVLQLKWRDIDFDRRTILWRASNDKMKRETITPAHPHLLGQLRYLRKKEVNRVFVFALPNKEGPMTRSHARKLYVQAEKISGMEPLQGSMFHAFRRGWATSRKHLPLKDVATGGGWTNPYVLLTLYSQADMPTMRKVIDSSVRVREGDLVISTQ